MQNYRLISRDGRILWKPGGPRTAIAAADERPVRLRIELTGLSRMGSFTASDAQSLAVQLLDGVCDALSD